MSDESVSIAATASQRKLFATLGAAVLLISLTLAFVLGGKKAPAAKDMEEDPQIGMLDASSIDLSAQATPDNWVDNTVAGAELAENAPSAAALSTERSSSLINGDGVEAQAYATVLATTPVPTAGAPGTTPANAVPPQAHVPATRVVGTTTTVAPPEAHAGSSGSGGSVHSVVKATPKPAAAVGGATQAATGAPPTATTAGGNAQVAQAAASRPAATGAGQTVTVAKAGSPASASVNPQTSSQGAPHPTPGKATKVAGAGATSSKPADAGSGRKNTDPKPVFVRPAQKRPGVVAQTRTLITEKQYTPPSASKPAAKPAAVEKNSGGAPARVRQQDARSYAQQATRQLQQQKALPPTQRVRLPRRAETTNPAIWHEDDTPANADERRPFGLVVAEEKPGFTPEGIPLRTDIPAGTSPLRQNGPDKPLWKRPE